MAVTGSTASAPSMKPAHHPATPLPPEPQDPARALRAAIRQASRGLVDREVLVDVIVLGAVAATWWWSAATARC
jgi:hypothetical protein